MRHRCSILFLIIILSGCSRPELSRTEFVLSTVCTITLYEYGKPDVYKKIFNRLREIDSLMSAYLEGSDVDRINKAAGKQPETVHPDVFEVIELACKYAELSGGAFDPTVRPLVALWDIGGDNERLPSQNEIDRVLPLINWRDIELDRKNHSVFLKRPGMALDLGAIAKGYAADKVTAIIKEERIPRAIVDLGGNIVLAGEKKDKSPWKIGIQNPLNNRGSYAGIVQTKETSVVTSGVYERFFIADGTRYHHIFSPQSGYPVSNGLLSVTIITGVSAIADALSTAVFVLGYEKGNALVESMDGVEAIFVFEDMGVRVTGGLDFTLSDNDFRILKD